MNTIKISGLALIIFLGGCMYVFGGYDDSPGAQGLGILMAIGGTWGVFRLPRRN